MEKINAKIENLSVAKLKEMATMLFSDNRDGVEIVLSAVLSALEIRMSEADFVSFCEAM